MRATILLAAISFIALTTTITTTEGQLLPSTACLFCVSLFRSMGCLDRESPLCQIIALKFKLVLDGDRLCNQFLCEGGYGESADGHQCKGQLQCLITKRKPLGICPASHFRHK